MHSNKISEKMVDKVQYKSIADMISRILIMDLEMLFIDDVPPPNNLEEQRITILDFLVKKFSETADVEQLSNISSILIDAINKYDRAHSSKLIIEHFIKSNYLECFFESLKQGEVIYIIKLIIEKKLKLFVCFSSSKQEKAKFCLNFIYTFLDFFITKTGQQTQVKML